MTWPSVPLRNVAHFVRGITFKPTDVVEPFSDGSVVCMRTKNVQATLDVRDLLAIPASFVKRKEQYLLSGDLLVSSANSWNLVGKCCWIGDLSYEATAGGFISILRADTSVVHPAYLYKWFSSTSVQDLVRNCGRQTTNISNLDFGQCLALEIPLPPLPEQRRIAALLDKADTLRQKRRAALAKLDELLQSVFVEMFGDPVTNPKGWPSGSIEMVVKSRGDIRCGPFGTQLKVDELVENGIPLYGIENVHNDVFKPKTTKFLTELKASQLSAFDVQKDDVLITRMGTIGRACVVPQLETKARISYHLFRVRPDSEKCNPKFLAATIARSGTFQAQLKQFSHGAIMAGLSTADLKNVKFLLPPVSKQNQYVALVEYAEKQRQRMQAAQGETEGLFASLQARAFAGEL